MTIGDLAPGVYTITERNAKPYVGENGGTYIVTVTAGDTTAAQSAAQVTTDNELVQIDAKKTWVNVGDANVSVTFALCANGAEVSVVTLSDLANPSDGTTADPKPSYVKDEDDRWHITWTNLPKYDGDPEAIRLHPILTPSGVGIIYICASGFRLNRSCPSSRFIVKWKRAKHLEGG